MQTLTLWGIYVSLDKAIIGSDYGLVSVWFETIVWTNVGILIETPKFSFQKPHLKMSSAECLPCCLGLKMLTYDQIVDIFLKMWKIRYWVICSHSDDHVYVLYRVPTPVGISGKSRELSSVIPDREIVGNSIYFVLNSGKCVRRIFSLNQNDGWCIFDSPETLL